eukprot:jgi/Psemu1/314845/fgenesh1_kg.1729_\
MRLDAMRCDRKLRHHNNATHRLVQRCNAVSHLQLTYKATITIVSQFQLTASNKTLSHNNTIQ